MSFIQREIDRIRDAMLKDMDGPNHDRLYAAMNALEWAKDPNHIKSPYLAITGKEEEPEGYSAPPRPLES